MSALTLGSGSDRRAGPGGSRRAAASEARTRQASDLALAAELVAGGQPARCRGWLRAAGGEPLRGDTEVRLPRTGCSGRWPGVRLAARRADAAGGQHHFGVDAADRSSVKCAAPGRASPLGTISGSVHANAGSPARNRRPSIRARSSSRRTPRCVKDLGEPGGVVHLEQDVRDRSVPDCVRQIVNTYTASRQSRSLGAMVRRSSAA